MLAIKDQLPGAPKEILKQKILIEHILKQF
jgi:hypothetical protein